MEVRLEHISKKYGSKYVLRDFTATLEKRSVMKILERGSLYEALQICPFDDHSFHRDVRLSKEGCSAIK